jgi:putative membrane protein
MEYIKNNEKKVLRFIIAVSIIVPVLVGIIIPLPKISLGFDTHFLAGVNAIINGSVAVLLLIGMFFIQSKKIDLHKKAMLTAFGLSALFLISYVLYHITNEHTVYEESCGPVPRWIYLTVLNSHIILSPVIIPLSSLSIFRALSDKFPQHRKIAKITFPLWLYVSVTGVLVYIWISGCYR